MSDNTNNKVLVLGGGLIGAETANAISKSGYQVSLATADSDIGVQEELDLRQQLKGDGSDIFLSAIEKVKGNNSVEILTNSTVSQVSGFAGDFNIAFKQDGTLVEKPFGAVVVTSDLKISDYKAAYGLKGAENVISIKELEEMVTSLKESDKGKTIAILLGLKKETNPLEFSRVLALVKELQKFDCKAYIFTNNIKLTAFNLDQEYYDTRNEGAVYVKSAEEPEFTIDKNSLKIVYVDSALQRKVELSPDMIVVDQNYAAADANSDLSEKFGINLSSNRFLQAENIRNIPTRTNQKGIFAIGSGKQIQGLNESLTDIDNTVLELDKLFKQPQPEGEQLFAEVDPEKCVICLTCYRSCQHGAITWVDGVAKVQEQACQACGICASECPMNAIQIKTYSDQDILEKLDAIPKEGLNLVAFCCKNSAIPAYEEAKKLELSTADSLSVIELPCAGKIDTEFIMEAFLKGIDGVVAVGCHTGNCKSEKGSIFARQRIAEVQKMLEVAGLEKERLAFNPMAANMGSGFSLVIGKMEAKIKELGPSPLK
jgi:quinone-modifying oxidoreductase, subunit QmoB